MKRALTVLLAVGGMIIGLAVGAQAAQASAVLIYIPFAFQAGDQWMPAGEYLFEFPRAGIAATGSLLRINTLDGSVCQHLLSRTIAGVTTDADWHVTFNKYGDLYYIAKIRNGELGAELSRTRKEKQLAAEYMQALKPVASVELRATHTRVK